MLQKGIIFQEIDVANQLNRAVFSQKRIIFVSPEFFFRIFKEGILRGDAQSIINKIVIDASTP